MIAEHLIDDDSLYGPAVLLREEGSRMARELALVIGISPKQGRTAAAEFEQVAKRLSTSGYLLRSSPNLQAMATQRAEHMSYVVALADHLGKSTAVLVRQS